MTTAKKDLDSRPCRFCGKPNPANVFVCLHCYKVLREKPKMPWYKMSIKPSLPVSVTLIALALAGIFFIKRWMENLEAQISMNFKSEDYSVSLIAEKKKGDVEISTPPN